MNLTSKQKKRLIKYLKKSLNISERLFHKNTILINRIESVSLLQVQINWEYQKSNYAWSQVQLQMSKDELEKVIGGKQ